MQTITLPTFLCWIQNLDFPRKLGICEKLFGSALRNQGIVWVETGAKIPWKLDMANPTHRWIVYGKYEGAPFLDWAKKFVPVNGMIVDSGANIGQMLMYFAQWVPQGRVFAFEPGKEASDWVEECLSTHPTLPVELIKLGLGSASQESYLNHLGNSSIHGAWSQVNDNEGEKIQITKLSEELSARSVQIVDLWKLDVEGYEIPALEGAESLLRERKIRAIYAELVGENGCRIQDYLFDFGYHCHLFDSSGQLHKASRLPERINGLFLPE